MVCSCTGRMGTYTVAGDQAVYGSHLFSSQPFDDECVRSRRYVRAYCRDVGYALYEHVVLCSAV